MTGLRRQPGVKSWYGKSVELAIETAEFWNACHPVGTLVDLLDEGRNCIATFRTKSSAQEMAGAASLFCDFALRSGEPIVGWVPLRRIRPVPKSQITKALAPVAPLGDDLPPLPLAPSPAKPGESPSDDGDDRRAMVHDEGRAEVGHLAVGDGNEVVQGSQEEGHRCAARLVAELHREESRVWRQIGERAMHRMRLEDLESESDA